MIETAYVKDKSGVVVCRDSDARTSYLAQRKIAEQQRGAMDMMQDQINNMQSELSEIKQLLTALLKKDS